MKFHQPLCLSAIILTISCELQHPDLKDGLYADIKTNKGNIIIKLENKKTPVTVANFVSLSEGNNPRVSDKYKNKPYYDGLLFHRVISDFMIQGGDPTGTGSGGPGYSFNDEITDLKHSGSGILSMANSGPATNGSQFFITHKETPWLDGKHTVFGRVVKGQNVVDSIAQNDTIKKISIIRKGSDAKKFNAPKIFDEYFKEKEKTEKEHKEKMTAINITNAKRFESLKSNSKTTSSGLQYIVNEKGNGPSVSETNRVLAHYAVYFSDGSLLETSMLKVAEANDAVNVERKKADQYQPIPADVSPKGKMIEGFKEGLRLLNIGDKATLFLPYALAYGVNGTGGIPPKSDLIFEVEIISQTK